MSLYISPFYEGDEKMGFMTRLLHKWEVGAVAVWHCTSTRAYQGRSARRGFLEDKSVGPRHIDEERVLWEVVILGSSPNGSLLYIYSPEYKQYYFVTDELLRRGDLYVEHDPLLANYLDENTLIPTSQQEALIAGACPLGKMCYWGMPVSDLSDKVKGKERCSITLSKGGREVEVDLQQRVQCKTEMGMVALVCDLVQLEAGAPADGQQLNFIGKLPQAKAWFGVDTLPPLLTAQGYEALTELQGQQGEVRLVKVHFGTKRMAAGAGAAGSSGRSKRAKARVSGNSGGVASASTQAQLLHPLLLNPPSTAQQDFRTPAWQQPRANATAGKANPGAAAAAAAGSSGRSKRVYRTPTTAVRGNSGGVASASAQVQLLPPLLLASSSRAGGALRAAMGQQPRANAAAGQPYPGDVQVFGDSTLPAGVQSGAAAAAAAGGAGGVESSCLELLRQSALPQPSNTQAPLLPPPLSPQQAPSSQTDLAARDLLAAMTPHFNKAKLLRFGCHVGLPATNHRSCAELSLLGLEASASFAAALADAGVAAAAAVASTQQPGQAPAGPSTLPGSVSPAVPPEASPALLALQRYRSFYPTGSSAARRASGGAPLQGRPASGSGSNGLSRFGREAGASAAVGEGAFGARYAEFAGEEPTLPSNKDGLKQLLWLHVVTACEYHKRGSQAAQLARQQLTSVPNYPQAAAAHNPPAQAP